MMDEVPDATVESLTQRVLAINFGAVHVRTYHRLSLYNIHLIHWITDNIHCMCDLVISCWSLVMLLPQVFASALYNLLTNPQYTQPLREEVEAIVEKEGWSRTSLSKMRKVDSFLKESIRIDGVDVC